MSTITDDLRDGPAAEWWERYTAGRENGREHRLVVFFRSLRPPPGGHARRVALVEKANAADSQGIVDGYEVRVLSEEVCLCTACQRMAARTQVPETVVELADWGDGQLTSTGFTRPERDIAVVGEQYRTVAPPETAIGVYLDDELAGVFPCVSDGIQYGVDVVLDALLEDAARPKPGPDLPHVGR